MAHKHKIDNHRESVSHYKKLIIEFIQGDIQFPMMIKDISIFEQSNNNLDNNSFIRYIQRIST